MFSVHILDLFWSILIHTVFINQLLGNKNLALNE